VGAAAIGLSQYQLGEIRLLIALLHRSLAWFGTVAKWTVDAAVGVTH
jgi:hypothetical protein